MPKKTPPAQLGREITEIASRTTGITLSELLSKCLTAIESGTSPDLPVVIRIQDEASKVCSVGAAFEAGTFADILEYGGRYCDGFVIDASTHYPVDGFRKEPTS
jgi:hypothetical protein